MIDPQWAAEVADRYLQELPRRWTHTQGVAGQARTLAPILGDNAGLVEAAAWLHDVGYSPQLVDCDFHPLDGARFLRDQLQADRVLTRLVAYHSEARVEAAERGLAEQLEAEFDPPPSELLEALVFCDMTTTPDGTRTTVEDRLAEIVNRYGPDHVVGRSIRRSGPRLTAATHAVLARLSGQASAG